MYFVVFLGHVIEEALVIIDIVVETVRHEIAQVDIHSLVQHGDFQSPKGLK